MERLPLVAVLAFVAFGIWAAFDRLLKKPPGELTQMDRLFGYLLVGRHFNSIHARVHERGYVFRPRVKRALQIVLVFAALALFAAAMAGNAALAA
jgi:hypothetical protein